MLCAAFVNTSRFRPQRKHGIGSRAFRLTPLGDRFRLGILESGECLQNCELNHAVDCGLSLKVPELCSSSVPCGLHEIPKGTDRERT